MLLPSCFWLLAAQGYRVADLDPNLRATSGVVWRVSDAGLAVGSAHPLGASDWQGAVYRASGPQFLPPLPGDEVSNAFGVNAAGTAVGESDDVVQIGHQYRITPHAVQWQNGTPVPLASLVTGGDPIEPLAAVAINDAGQVLGWGRDAAGSAQRAFLFDGGLLTDLGALPGGSGAAPNALNRFGAAVGAADVAGGFRHAFLWQNGVMTDLHDPQALPGRVSSAWDINERGQVCGGGDYGADFLDYEVATLWDQGTVVRLGLLAGNESWARGLNDHGVVVGGAVDAAFQNVAVIWERGALSLLNARIPPGSGWHLLIANDVDNFGRIVGEGAHFGVLRPFLLVPDGGGGFQVYGAGCPGGNGETPYLTGSGAATPGGAVSCALTRGTAGSPGMLLAGRGTGRKTLAAGCELQILPLLPPRLPFTLDAAGSAVLEFTLPAPLAAGVYNLQAVLRAGGAPVTSNPLHMEVR